jgi:dephospho-CoA kinase
MLIAGLTGGMACGKTFVAKAFKELGCQIIEADDLGHEVMKPGGTACAPVIAAFGKEIVDANGFISRPALAARVFGNPEQLAKLNAIVHPAVAARSAELTAEIAAAAPHAIVIHVAAILIESGAHKHVDKIIVVTCTPEQQRERALSRPNAIRSDIEARILRQMPLGEKKAFADYVIDASGTEADTLRQTRLVWEDLKRQA